MKKEDALNLVKEKYVPEITSLKWKCGEITSISPHTFFHSVKSLKDYETCSDGMHSLIDDSSKKMYVSVFSPQEHYRNHKKFVHYFKISYEKNE
jgi:hypothetical protein